MTLFVRALAVAALVCTFATPAVAQNVAAKRVTLDLNAVAPDAAFKAVADAIGVTVTVDGFVTAPVDIKVRNVSAKTALNAMCESVGCSWTITGSALAVKPLKTFAIRVSGRADGSDPEKLARTQAVLDALKQKLPADMKFENAPLETVSTRLSEALGLHVQLTCKDPAVRMLTADLSNQSMQSALQAIADQEARPGAAWQMLIGPGPGDSKTPSIGIMVAPRVVKKDGSQPRKIEIFTSPKDEKKR
jgi:hypothetical protein